MSNCTSCVGVGGCGYCLSTLQCVDGTASGPSDGSPCPSWISEPDVCPGTLRHVSKYEYILYMYAGFCHCTQLRPGNRLRGNLQVRKLEIRATAVHCEQKSDGAPRQPVELARRTYPQKKAPKDQPFRVGHPGKQCGGLLLVCSGLHPLSKIYGNGKDRLMGACPLPHPYPILSRAKFYCPCFEVCLIACICMRLAQHSGQELALFDLKMS